MATIMYGLKHIPTGKLLGFETEKGGDEFCVPVEFDLQLDNNSVWLVSNFEVAKKAAENNPDWYAQSYDSPGNQYVGSVEAVEITLSY